LREVLELGLRQILFRHGRLLPFQGETDRGMSGTAVSKTSQLPTTLASPNHLLLPLLTTQRWPRAQRIFITLNDFNGLCIIFLRKHGDNAKGTTGK
jgi:hypothetical protein